MLETWWILMDTTLSQGRNNLSRKYHAKFHTNIFTPLFLLYACLFNENQNYAKELVGSQQGVSW